MVCNCTHLCIERNHWHIGKNGQTWTIVTHCFQLKFKKLDDTLGFELSFHKQFYLINLRICFLGEPLASIITLSWTSLIKVYWIENNCMIYFIIWSNYLSILVCHFKILYMKWMMLFKDIIIIRRFIWCWKQVTLYDNIRSICIHC